jgi:hypothetical protein
MSTQQTSGPDGPDDPDGELTEFEVIGRLWFAHDMVRFARAIGVFLVLASGVAIALAMRSGTAPAPGWSPESIVALATLAAAGGIGLCAFARRRPDLAVPFSLGALTFLVAVGARETVAIALGTVVLGATWWTWNARMQQALRLAARHPHLQAAKALRGEPYRRDPHAP